MLAFVLMERCITDHVNRVMRMARDFPRVKFDGLDIGRLLEIYYFDARLTISSEQ